MENQVSCLILGGTWDDHGGKPSSLMDSFYNIISTYLNPNRVVFYNGGNIDTLLSMVKNNHKKYDYIISYSNYDINRYGHLDLRSHYRGSIITIVRKNHNHTVKRFKSYISYSKSDYLVDLLSVDDKINSRIMNSNGIVISNYSSSLRSTLTRLLNECYKKHITPKVRMHYDQNYETTKNDLSVLQNTFDLIKKETSLNVSNLSVRIPGRYLTLGDKVINIDSRIVTTSSSWNQNKYLSRRSLSLIYYDERYKGIRYGNSKPSSDSYTHKIIYSLFDDINYIVKSNDYFKESLFLDRIPVMRSKELSSLMIRSLECTDNKVISIPGQGTYIFLKSLSSIPSLTKVPCPEKVIPEYTCPTIENNKIVVGGETVQVFSLIEKKMIDGEYIILPHDKITSSDLIRII